MAASEIGPGSTGSTARNIPTLMAPIPADTKVTALGEPKPSVLGTYVEVRVAGHREPYDIRVDDVIWDQ